MNMISIQKSKYALWLAALAILGASCSQNELLTPNDGEDNPATGEEITIRATQGSQADTRLGYKQDGSDLKVTWAAGDKITIYNNSSNKEDYTLATGAKGQNATFKGRAMEGSDFNAVYPNNSATSWEDCEFNMNGQKQIGNNNPDHLADYTYMTAKHEKALTEGAITFEHKTAVLRLELYLEDVVGTPRSVELFTEAEGGTGFGIRQKASDGKITYNDRIRLDLEEVTAETTELVVYLAVLPSTIKGFIKVWVTTDQGVYEFEKSLTGASKKYEATQMYSGMIGGFSKKIDAGQIFDNTVAGRNGTYLNSIEFGGGDGLSESAAYEISTAEQLKKLVYEVNKDKDFSKGKYFKLTNDIHITADTWTPIGIGNEQMLFFYGTFDGNDKTISGTMKDNNDVGEFGFFGNVSACTIKNLNIDATVNGTNTSENCHVGGIIGSITGNVSSSSAIQKCTFNGSVSSSSSYYSYAGGIAGATRSNGSFTSCSNSGAVSSSSSSYNAAYAGGIAGGIIYNGSITSCNNSGAVTSSSPYIAYAGGIAGGTNNGSINRCENLGAVNASSYYTSSYNAYAGGIVGWFNDSDSDSFTYNKTANPDISTVNTIGPDNTYAGAFIGKTNNSSFTLVDNNGIDNKESFIGMKYIGDQEKSIE